MTNPDVEVMDALHGDCPRCVREGEVLTAMDAAGELAATAVAVMPPKSLPPTVTATTPSDMLALLDIPSVDGGDPFAIMKTRQNPYAEMGEAELVARETAEREMWRRKTLAQSDAMEALDAAGVAFAQTLIPAYREALRANWPALMAYAAVEDGLSDALHRFNRAVSDHIQSAVETAGIMVAVAVPITPTGDAP